MKLFFICLLLVPLIGWGQTTDSNYVKGKIYVKFKDTVSIPNPANSAVINVGELTFIEALVGKKVIMNAQKPFFTTSKLPSSLRLQKIYELELVEPELIEEILKKISQEPTIEYAERIPIMRMFYIPNDYSSYDQYSLHIIDAVHAWDVTRGSTNIVVSVVDCGFQTDHEDLAANMVAGRDVSNDDNDPTPPPNVSGNFHGTHVAGIVSAVTNNSVGIASLGFNVKVMPIKASDGRVNSKDEILITHGYQGIVYAADHGARIINMSWGGPVFSQTNQGVINYAADRDCILIGSAGNNGTNQNNYPAAYDNVISVASTDMYNKKSSFSQFGNWVDIAAPGSEIFSTMLNNSYEYLSGTSMAAPLVSSLAALMLSVNPTMTSPQVEAGLKATTHNIDAQNPDYVGQLGAGRIDAYKAVKWAETVYSTANGSWTSAGNWTYQTPSILTNPVIQTGHTITVPSASYQTKNSLTVNGILDLSTINSVININNN